jgi:hypothetical protein
VAAINTFRSEHGGVPLVVCARSRDYHELADRLVLNGAVVVRPLDRGQVRGWLMDAGRPLAGLRTALRDRDHWLWGLLDSPLLLSIAALTYKGQPARAVRAHGSTKGLLDAYVAAMLARPRAPLAARQDQLAYADADTLRWLGWLAERMGEQSVFYPDWMQPDWLPTRRQRWLATTGLGLAVALTGGLACGLVLGLSVGLSVGLERGLVGGLVGGLGGAWAGALGTGLTRDGARIGPVEQVRWTWSRARSDRVMVMFGLGAGLSAWLGFGMVGAWVGRLGVGLLIGLGAGLAIVVSTLLANGFQSRPNVRPAVPLEGIRAAARVGRSSGLSMALGTGAPTALLLGMVGGGGLAVVGVGLTAGLGSALFLGLARGGASYLRHRLLIVLLRRQGLVPADLVGFLDYADSRILLRRVGGGYLFIHRLLQDYFPNRATRSAHHTPPTPSDPQGSS